jgi:hypothetical protein
MYDLGLKECFFTLKLQRGDKKFILKHVFRLPSFKDWYEYLRHRKFMGLSKGKDTYEFANVMQEQDLAFWESLIVRVEGYTTQKKDLMDFDDWKVKIPVDHKLESMSGFLMFNRHDEVSASEAVATDGFDIDDEVGRELEFAAVQDGNEVFVKFYFGRPETSDYVKFNRMSSKMQLVRTKQRNVSEMRVPADIRPFVEMFDKLIVKVEGYGFGGKDLMKIDDWKSRIDAYHKREAVRELFTTSLLDEEEGN